MTQYQILAQMAVTSEIMPKFTNPEEWCFHFPPISKHDLTKFGCHIDFDRSFITTSLNPYYNSFIRWQFNTLKARGYLKFGKRPSIYSPKDKQMCADHDRAEGEGAVPQEYVLIKLKVIELNAALKEKLDGKDVFLVAATLRPETMYGQTNCFLLPTGEYGAFEMKDGQVFICSDKSARNMSFQNMTKVEGEVNKVATFKGQDLLGLPLKAPLTKYEKVYSLPMMTISMDKGTGVVTSVPSDAPDDWAALSDLKNKKALREKFGITEEMVHYDPVEIINIPGYGNLAAIKACEDLKIKGQNDKELLAQAKADCYKKGFYEGKMIIGKY
jgi:leucyl-tRNA synthetase